MNSQIGAVESMGLNCETEGAYFTMDGFTDYSPQFVSKSADYYDGNIPFVCSICNFSGLNSEAELRRHNVLHHGEWPLVYDQSEGLSSEEIVYVCFKCNRHYGLIEDLRGHFIEFHKYEPIEKQGIKFESSGSIDSISTTIESKPESEATASKPGTSEKTATHLGFKDISQQLTSGIEASDPAQELRPLPFKDFRLLLRAKMLLRCPASTTCIYKFETNEKIQFHASCHKSDACKNKFMCKECGLEFTNWRICSSHLWKVHEKDIDMLHCPITACEFRAHASVLVWRHMRFHKTWRSHIIKSLRAVRDRRSRRDAAKRKAEEIPKKIEPKKNKYYAEKICEICNRKFVNGKTLSKHVKSVHNKIKPFICNICGKKMSRKAHLIIHTRQHTGEKPLQCHICEFATRDPSVLKKHQKRHENGEGGKHKCNFCDYVCIQTNAFKRHMRLNHPEEFKKISCDLCTFVTISEQRLHEHKEDHRKGLIINAEDSLDAGNVSSFKNPRNLHDKPSSRADISADYFLPLESVDSLPHEPTVDTGGVTIPAPPSEDTQFPTYLNN